MSESTFKKIHLTDENDVVVITIDGSNGNMLLGSEGHDGDITLTDGKGVTTIRLNGFDGAVHLGGPGQDGDIKLKNVKDQQTIHLNGRSGAIHLGGPDVDGEVFIKNSKGSEVIILDGNAGDIKIQGKVHTADFVFENDYHLPKIEEVDSFIKENKHLPDVPSASDLKANGVGLQEFSMQLLRKVEELTLYLIEQNQTIQSQQERIEQLENRVNG